MEKMLRVEEVAVLIGSSVKTINNWYVFKKIHPENTCAKLLPEFKQQGNRQTRYWKESDLWRLVEFKNSIPKGRNGFMGDVTQRYYRKVKKNDFT